MGRIRFRSCPSPSSRRIRKTTTLKEIVRSIPSKQKVAVLAFNAHMAAELEAKLPKRITVSTIHKMGMYVLTRYFGRPFSCNDTKYHHLANQHLQHLSLENKDQQRASRTWLKEIIHYLQITLTEPTESGILALISHFGIETPDNLADLLPLPERILAEGRDQATQRFNIGLDDLLWLPHVLNLQPKPKDWVLIDEAQDLSRAQLDLVLKLPSDTGRLEGSCDQLPLEQTVLSPAPSITSEQPDPEEFQIEVDALHKECQSLLWRFVQIAQAWQADFPDQMQVVWPRIETELQSKSWGSHYGSG
ncbi:MAG: AAA family ATPase [Synechococcaceae cyanobacterium RM1_1_27]|nr:AAA family ATPase [Synechococcaceae cyanobacterium RM1_1_27]